MCFHQRPARWTCTARWSSLSLTRCSRDSTAPSLPTARQVSVLKTKTAKDHSKSRCLSLSPSAAQTAAAVARTFSRATSLFEPNLQSGTGKTHTMEGYCSSDSVTVDDPGLGIIPRALYQVSGTVPCSNHNHSHSHSHSHISMNAHTASSHVPFGASAVA